MQNVSNENTLKYNVLKRYINIKKKKKKKKNSVCFYYYFLFGSYALQKTKMKKQKTK